MKKLKNNQIVCLRDDLENGQLYGETYWASDMEIGTFERVVLVNNKEQTFEIEDGDGWEYTFQMIDWDKTDGTTDDDAFSVNLKTDSNFMAVVFSGDTGSMIKQEEGSVITADNLDKEEIMNHIKDVMKYI